MNLMDEKEAEKRLKQVRKRLKHLKERRYEYTGKLEKSKRYRKIFGKEWEQSIVFSAIISGIISMTVFMLLYRFSAPEFLKISVTILLFITLTYLIHIKNEAMRDIEDERYLKVIDCLIEELEREEERIITEFPEADRWVPSMTPTTTQKSGHRLNLLIELLLFILSPTITEGVLLLLYLGALGTAFIFTITKRSREMRRWEKECEERGKLVGLD